MGLSEIEVPSNLMSILKGAGMDKSVHRQRNLQFSWQSVAAWKQSIP